MWYWYVALGIGLIALLVLWSKDNDKLPVLVISLVVGAAWPALAIIGVVILAIIGLMKDGPRDLPAQPKL